MKGKEKEKIMKVKVFLFLFFSFFNHICTRIMSLRSEQPKFRLDRPRNFLHPRFVGSLFPGAEGLRVDLEHPTTAATHFQRERGKNVVRPRN